MKRSPRVIVAYVGIALLAASLVCILFSFFGKYETQMLFYLQLAHLLSLVFAILYLLVRFRKDGAVFFKCFLAVMAATCLLRTVAVSTVSSGWVLACYVLVFGILCVLFEAKDLGKFKSFVLGITALALEVISSVGIFASGWKAISGKLADVILALMLLIMIVGKYRDKEARAAAASAAEAEKTQYSEF